jgi:4-amino-4-deoxy-L-arabinose transferase-like glycosyltransferase
VLQGYNVTDPPAVFFSLWTLDLAHRALATGRTRWWLLAGLAMAAAAQSKFLTLGLLPAAAVLLLVLRAPERPKPRQLAASVAAMAVGLSPLLLWNAENAWDTFAFNFVGRNDDSVGWRWRNLPEFVGGQLGALSPLLAVVAAAAMWSTSRRLRQATLGERVLVAGAAVPMLLFLLMCGVRTVGIHWPAVAWGPALVLAVALVAAPGAAPAWPGRRTWRWSLGLAAALYGLLHVLPLAPEVLLRLDVGGFGRDGQVHTRKVAELWGWHELADEAVRRRAELARGNPAGAFVITNQFGVAGMLQFYSQSTLDPKLWCFVKDHGESVRRWQRLPSLRGQDAVFVVKRKVEEELPKLREHFARVDDPVELVIRHEGVAVRSFWLVECHAYDGREPYPLER